MNRLNPGVLVAALVCGCGSSVTVNNTNPRGTVSGLVIDPVSEMPIDAVNVQIISGAQTLTATTDMTGVFRVSNVPVGNFIITLTKETYLSAQFTDELTGAVGNFPVSNPGMTIGP